MSKGNYAIVALLCGILGMQVWSHAQQSSQTLTAQDYNEIQQLYARYAFAIDTVNAEAFADLFTSDGAFQTNVGRDALLNFVKVNVARDVATNHKKHWNSNLVINPSPEGAKGACYLLAINSGTRPPTLIAEFHYDDSLVKTAQGWKFKKRVVISDSPPVVPTPAAKQ